MRDAREPSVVRVRLFGSLAVCADGRWLGPRDFGGMKPKQLLEMLLLERACRAAMLGHYALGDQSGALGAYARCRATLARELGVVPLPETLALHSAVLRQEPVEALLPSLVRPAPPVCFASHGGVRLAYQTVGEGTTSLVFVPPFATHLGSTWDDPTYAGFLDRLASFTHLTLFDKRGTGLSDPVIEWPSVEDRADDIAAVLDAASVDRAVLFGVCDGGVLCALCAARHPERVAGLVIAAGFARWLRTEDYPYGWSPRFHQAFVDSFEEAWARGAAMQHVNPSVAELPRYRNWFSRHVRLGVSPGMARRLAELNLEIDIRGVLPQILAPTLVLTRTEDPWIRAENSRYLAQQIPDAELLELPGVDHEPWIGDSAPVFAAIERLIARVATPVSLAPR